MTRFLALLALLLGVAFADSGDVSLAPVVTAITGANEQVVLIRNGIIILLSSLLAIALVVLLYKNTGGGK